MNMEKHEELRKPELKTSLKLNEDNHEDNQQVRKEAFDALEKTTEILQKALEALKEALENLRKSIKEEKK